MSHILNEKISTFIKTSLIYILHLIYQEEKELIITSQARNIHFG